MNWIKNLLVKIGIVIKEITPELIRYLKAAIKLGIRTLLPIALEAVSRAQQRGGTGEEKFKFAVDYVKSQAPAAAMGAIHTVVQDAYLTRTAEGWK